MKLMKSFIGIGILAISCVGCTSSMSLDKFAYQTRTNINSKLSYGMSKQQVISLMGAEIYDAAAGGEGVISKPFKTAMYTKNEVVIEIVYYYTEYKNSRNRVDDDELTPLVFINGKLDSWGWESWVEKAKRYDINVNYKVN
ncbi:MAG: DUF3192 domain-containing protein [Holophagaceae bacterium]